MICGQSLKMSPERATELFAVLHIEDVIDEALIMFDLAGKPEFWIAPCLDIIV